MQNKINVLDHGYVRLADHMGNDLTVVRRARHMPDAEWRGDRDIKLIYYLMKNKHTSPFEFVEFDFEIKAPIFVARQWMRHRTWNYNEISGRYQELPEETYAPESRHVGVQSPSNHQGRIISDERQQIEDNLVPAIIDQASGAAFETYRELLRREVPRELARCVLPLSIYTVFSAKVDLHNLLHFLNLRLDEHAQYEIRVYAEAIRKLIHPIVPVTMAAWLAGRQPAVPKDRMVEKIEAIIASLDGPHVDHLHLKKGYTLSDLQAELRGAIGK